MHHIFYLICIRVSSNGLCKYLRQFIEYIFDIYHVHFCCQYTLASTTVIPGENSAESLFSFYAVASITQTVKPTNDKYFYTVCWLMIVLCPSLVCCGTSAPIGLSY